MNIETVHPHPALQQYIDFYYLIKNDSPTFSSIHYSFPHTVNVISIYQKANFKSVIGSVEIFNDPQNDYLTLLQGKCQIPLKVELKGETDRISIFFKSTGLNHFVKAPISALLSKKTTELLEWTKHPNYKIYLDKSFNNSDPKKRIAFLEKFLLDILNPVDITEIAQATKLLSDFDSEYTMDEVASLMQVSLRTFNRHFKEFIGVSPIEFQRIARFRHSLNTKLFNDHFKRLTDIGYHSNFYDQSYFIKMYKKLTGSNPKAFFNTIEKLGDNKLIFQFVKK